VAVRGLAAAGPEVDVVRLLAGGRRRRFCLLLGSCLWHLLLPFPLNLTEIAQLLLPFPLNLTEIAQLLLPSGSFAAVTVITLPKLLFHNSAKDTPEIAQSCAHLVEEA
jgi:hypothetical protein